MRNALRSVGKRLALLILPVAVSFPALVPHTAIAACQNSGRYYYAESYSSYPGGADGISARFQLDTVTPYVCAEAASHTVESVAMYLPNGPNDFLEIGVDRGEATNTYGGQACPQNCPGQYWFFTFSNTPSNGASNLYVGGPVAGTSHTNSIQQFVRCTPNCYLYAHFRTDATDWPENILPAGDFPSTSVLTNGEVLNDPTDAMGGNTFDQLQYHASGWLGFTNYSVSTGYDPYCNYNTSSGGVFSSYNWGPHGAFGC